MKILITGVAGFIGFHTAKKFIDKGYQVVGIDNLNDYYDVNLKKSRLKILANSESFTFHEIDISYTECLNILKNYEFKYVIHLAAQAGVRYSITNPDAYIKTNLVGFFNIISLANLFDLNNFVYASSSSIYGIDNLTPYDENMTNLNPASLYAATKICNETIAQSLSNISKFKNYCGLRFFTVYGPWGRPDMALFKFTKSILNNEKIEIYNHGEMLRDFTYIDDIVEGIFLITLNYNKNHHDLYNIGNGSPITLMKFVNLIEHFLDKKALISYKDMQLGDVKETHANIDKIKTEFGFNPKIKPNDGIKKFISWYKEYYGF